MERFKIRNNGDANGGDNAARILVATSAASVTSTVPQVAAATLPFSHWRPKPRDNRNDNDARLEYATTTVSKSVIMGKVSAAATVPCVS